MTELEKERKMEKIEKLWGSFSVLAQMHENILCDNYHEKGLFRILYERALPECLFKQTLPIVELRDELLCSKTVARNTLTKLVRRSVVLSLPKEEYGINLKGLLRLDVDIRPPLYSHCKADNQRLFLFAQRLLNKWRVTASYIMYVSEQRKLRSKRWFESILKDARERQQNVDN